MDISLLADGYQNDENSEDVTLLSSPRIGGSCRITREARAAISAAEPKQVHVLRRALFDAQRMNLNPLISADFVKAALSRRKPTFEETSNAILRPIRDLSLQYGQRLAFWEAPNRNYLDLTLETLTFQHSANHQSVDKGAILFFLEYLRDESLIRLDLQDGPTLRLLPRGYMHLEKAEASRSAERQAFVAMWFNNETDDAWESGIKKGIEEAGYEAFRIDRHHHENHIDDEIIAQIRQSRFLVADFTCGSVTTKEGNKDVRQFIVRGGVYFEAGFALGLGIPVIWTVKKDRFESLHFDTNHYPHIVWDTTQDLREQITNRVIALIGKGPTS